MIKIIIFIIPWFMVRIKNWYTETNSIKLSNPRVFENKLYEYHYACNCGNNHKVEESSRLVTTVDGVKLNDNVKFYYCKTQNYIQLYEGQCISSPIYINWLQKRGLSIDDNDLNDKLTIRSVIELSEPEYSFNLQNAFWTKPFLDERIIQFMNYLVDFFNIRHKNCEYILNFLKEHQDKRFDIEIDETAGVIFDQQNFNDITIYYKKLYAQNKIIEDDTHMSITYYQHSNVFNIQGKYVYIEIGIDYIQINKEIRYPIVEMICCEKINDEWYTHQNFTTIKIE